MSRLFFLIIVAAAIFLAATNPSEADFREHVRLQSGVAGRVGLAVTDLLSGDGKGGIKRENFIVASRFYVGGDTILPRKDVAWGVGGKFFDIKDDAVEIRDRR